MKIASRIIGAVLGLAGLVFLLIAAVLSKPDSVLAPRDLSGTFAYAAFAIVFLGAAWYFLRVDIDSLSDDEAPPSAFTVFLARHRLPLKHLAEAGFLGSLVLFSLVCFGASVPRWVDSIASCAMVVICLCCFRVAGADKSKRRPVPGVQRITARLVAWIYYAAVLLMIADQFLHKNPFDVAQHRLGRSASLVVMTILFAAAAWPPTQTASTEDASGHLVR